MYIIGKYFSVMDIILIGNILQNTPSGGVQLCFAKNLYDVTDIENKLNQKLEAHMINRMGEVRCFLTFDLFKVFRKFVGS